MTETRETSNLIVVIDNYDSFTYNIVAYYRAQLHRVQVYRNDAITIAELENLNPSLIVLSPGPKSPEFAGITQEILKVFAGVIPIFGVCLGCQSIAFYFGASIIKARNMYHGKTSIMTHAGTGVLQGVASPMTQMRYHSLIIDESTLSSELEITARSEEGEIMAIRHKHLGIEGVQFHPESIASMEGTRIMDNALCISVPHTVSSSYTTHSNTATLVSPSVASPRVLSDDSPAAIASLQKYIHSELLQGNNLTQEPLEQFMRYINEGKITSEVVAMFLTALRMKGETIEEITTIAEIAREFAIKLPIVQSTFPHLVDIVGTGGDASNTFNISTASSLVASGAGAQVAKHGNRAVSSQCGSADVLEELGINIECDSQTMATILRKAGMCFMFAPLYHPSMKYVAPVRKALGIRTVFNIMGPLLNPALVPNILLGVYDKSLLSIMVQTLHALGVARALVIYSDMGADEISMAGTTHVMELQEGTIQEYTIHPQEYFKNECIMDEIDIDTYRALIQGGDSSTNALLIEDLLRNRLKDPLQKKAIEQTITINAGAALYISKNANSIEEGISLAYHSIQSGAALHVLEQMRSYNE